MSSQRLEAGSEPPATPLLLDVVVHVLRQRGVTAQALLEHVTGLLARPEPAGGSPPQRFTHTERVCALLKAQPPVRPPALPAAARALGMSPRTLRRRLAQEGTTYRELSQSRRCEAARELLRNPELTLQGVAVELGFSDLTAFHRAFRRWSGRTPGEYRAALGGPQGLLR